MGASKLMLTLETHGTQPTTRKNIRINHLEHIQTTFAIIRDLQVLNRKIFFNTILNVVQWLFLDFHT